MRSGTSYGEGPRTESVNRTINFRMEKKKKRIYWSSEIGLNPVRHLFGLRFIYSIGD